MPTIKHSHLLRLPVTTESGQHLGSVSGFIIDIETHTIMQYEVRLANFTSLVRRERLLIHATQVVRITKEGMIVRDTTSPLSARGSDERISLPEKDPMPILSRES